MVRWLLAAWLILLAPCVLAAQLTASIDRRELLTTEHLLLTLTLADSDTRLRAEGINPNIDLTPLNRDFDLGEPQSQHQFHIRNGRGIATSTLQIALFPKRPGSLTIPAFRLADLHSKAMTVTVKQADRTTIPEVFTRGGSLKTALWNREQTLVYIDLYHRIELKSAQLGGHLQTIPLDIDLTALPQQTRSEEIDGLEYRVSRSAWLLAPRHDGNLQIEFPEIWLETRDGRRLRLPTSQTTISVKALPAGTPALTLIGQPQLSQTLTPASIQPGKLAKWEIKIEAPVPVTSLPEALPKLTFPENLTVYYERPQRQPASDSGQVSRIIYPVLINADKAGRYTLPAIELPYFDPRRGEMALLRQAGPTLTVSGTPATSATAPAATSLDNPASSATVLWQITTGIFALLWLGSLFFLWQRNPRHGKPTATPPDHHSHDDLKARLLSAMQTTTLEQGLIKWAPLFAADDQARTTVQTLQKLYYAADKSTPADRQALEQQVAQCIDKLVSAAAETAHENKQWLPENFTAAGKTAAPR